MELSDKTKRKFRNKVVCDGHWWWKGAKDHRGYGRFYVRELQQNVPAHRVLFEQLYGVVPDGLELHHICGHRDCVDPHHIQAVTHRRNSQLAAEAGSWRGEKSGRTNKKEADIKAIILLHEHLHIPVKKITEATGIPLRTVYSYIKREAWSHVKLPSTPSERDEYLQKYLNGDLPVEDSPYSRQIRSLIKHWDSTSFSPQIDIWDGDSF